MKLIQTSEACPEQISKQCAHEKASYKGGVHIATMQLIYVCCGCGAEIFITGKKRNKRELVNG